MIIGLSGYARTGKDTIANHLVENYGFTRMSFADPMREALVRLNPSITIGNLQGASLAWAVGNMGWEKLKEVSPDVRGLLQRMGTEVGRNMFGETFWVDYLMNKALELKTNIVIPDVRFINEADAIRLWNGEVWRVNRSGVDPVNDHASEIELDAYPHFSLIINNDSTVENLFFELTPIFEGMSVHNVS